MAAFDASKASILENIASGVDFSFKGSIDAPIQELVNFINGLDDFYTTSSCSGRVSVFRSGVTAKSIKWLLVRHRSFHKVELLAAIQKPIIDEEFADLVTLKCEPFILHINCRDVESAKSLHEVVTLCGFRESGIKLGSKKVMLAVRTTANCMELPLARGNNLMVSDTYLDLIIEECNARLASNFSRIDKFLLALKSHFGWPRIVLLPNTARSPLETVRRWGHTCCIDPLTGATYIIGGYGLNNAAVSRTERAEEHSQRKLDTLVYHPPQGKRQSGQDLVVVPGGDDSIHAASAVLVFRATVGTEVGSVRRILLLSGGRHSPTTPLPCLRLLDPEQGCAPVSYAQQGATGPSPRWGHSLTMVRQRSDSYTFLLYGGRDHEKVLCDSYLLRIEWSGGAEEACAVTWTELALQAHSGEASLLAGRFFHAACATPNVFPADDSPSSPELDMVVVHGGLLSIADPYCCGRGLVIDPNTGIVRDLLEPAVPVRAGDESGGAAAGTDTESSAVVPGLHRFGHTLTSIGAKCLLLLGGTSFHDEGSGCDEKCTSSPALILDVYIDVDGSYRATPRTVEGWDESGVALSALPCQGCRAHHQTLYDPAQRSLQIVGGGALTLAFGAHYCPGWSARVALHSQAPAARAPTALSTGSAAPQANNGRKVSAAPAGVNPTSTDAALFPATETEAVATFPVFFVPAQKVRAVKVLLEERGQLDKAHSITRVEKVELLSCCESGNVLVNVALEAPYSLAVDVNVEHTAQALCDGEQYMAVPLTDAFDQQLRAQARPLPAALCTLLDGIRGIMHPQAQLLLGRYRARSSKRSQVNCAKKANDLLLALSAQHRLPISATSEVPSSRFEVVGDVLMLPESYLSGPSWDAVLGLAADPTGSTIADPAAPPAVASYRQKVFGALAGCFGLQRVARKAEIDSGPKRESKVRLLHPVVGVPVGTGPGAEGWVTVWENKIAFGFDITRVMFCSGNVTERMRMGTVQARGQVVVDLYCGIGYYTVPLLVHAGAAQVHACEWNPNSVLALRENLRRAGVSQRCQVYEGDNRVTSQQLDSLADRVLLGLLPSSVQGWPLAARALKGTGGTIHVHENVHENILTAWVEETRETFEGLLRGLSKQLQVSVLHLERVKSYAPRVYHVVLDLECATISRVKEETVDGEL